MPHFGSRVTVSNPPAIAYFGLCMRALGHRRGLSANKDESPSRFFWELSKYSYLEATFPGTGLGIPDLLKDVNQATKRTLLNKSPQQ